ncbi:MAG: STAS domain-containing protein [Candidatus Hydrogenedentes bacterium]|nr:STAS domain-containing protein [Candidatus Hydrogenedentota bacterium]
MALELNLTEQHGEHVIVASGEVDLYSSPALRDAILKAVPKTAGKVAVDLRAVVYMDSSGVATLVEGLKAAGAKQKTFVLLAPSHAVMKVLQLSRLDSVFTIVEAL